jgi:hypothetical protein
MLNAPPQRTSQTAIRKVGTMPVTSFNRGMSLEAIAAMLGHKSLDMTLRYANSQELHQTGELNTALGQLAA